MIGAGCVLGAVVYLAHKHYADIKEDVNPERNKKGLLCFLNDLEQNRLLSVKNKPHDYSSFGS